MLTFDEKKHEYKLDGLVIPSVTQIIKAAGLINLDYVGPQLLKEKADLGKKVHLTTELYDRDSLNINELHPTLKEYLDGWIKFKEDYNFTPTEIELMSAHHLYKFAGRIDRIGFIAKDLTLLDIKSGSKQKSNAIQTAGYALLYDQDKKKTEQIKKRMVVYLLPEGYRVESHTDPNDKNVFLAALTISNFKKGSK